MNRKAFATVLDGDGPPWPTIEEEEIERRFPGALRATPEGDMDTVDFEVRGNRLIAVRLDGLYRWNGGSWEGPFEI